MGSGRVYCHRLFFLLTQHRAHLLGILPYLLLLAWRTLVTLVLFPILVVRYVHLAHGEERDYMMDVPAFCPRLGRSIPPPEIGSRERHGQGT